MPYSDNEIRDYALKLEAKGATPAEIEAFVSGAKAEQPAAKKTEPLIGANVPSSSDEELAASPIRVLKAAFGRGTPADNAEYNALRKVDQGQIPGAIAASVPTAVGASIGQKLGSSFGLPGRVAGGAIGAGVGDLASQGAQMFVNPDQKFDPGQLAGNMVSGGIPGGTSALGGGRALLKEGVKQGVGAVASTAANTLVNQGRFPTFNEAALSAGVGSLAGAAAQKFQSALPPNYAPNVAAVKMANEGADATRKATLETGWVVPPGALRRDITVAGQVMDWGANSSSTFERVSKMNQPVTNRVAREYADLPANTPLLKKNLDDAIEQATKPYEAVAKLSPQAEVALEGMKDARAEAKKWWRAYAVDFDPKKMEQADGFEALANSYHGDLVNEARLAGKSSLIDRLDEARIRLAKLHFLESATNPATGDVSARSFGALKKAKPELDLGPGDKIANAYLAYEPAFQDVAKIGAAENDRVRILKSIAEKYQLSRFKQTPNAIYPVQPSMMAKFGNQAAQSSVNSFLTPIPKSTDPAQNNPFLQNRP